MLPPPEFEITENDKPHLVTFFIPLQLITTFKSARAINGAHTRYAPCQTSQIKILLEPKNTVPSLNFSAIARRGSLLATRSLFPETTFCSDEARLERILELFPVKIVAMFYLRSSTPHELCREDLDYAQSSSLTRTSYFARVWCCVDTALTDGHLATKDDAAFRCSNSQSGMAGAKTTFPARLSPTLLDENLPRTIDWQLLEVPRW